MVFSELYSAYYNTVAKIITAAFDGKATEADLRRCAEESAFSESALTILPALKNGRWPLLREDLSPVLKHEPTMPLTLLEKRWLKAIMDDPRVKLFGVEFPELEGVAPLFTADDYKIYDRYTDGDPYEDEKYIKHFQTLLSAVKNGKPVKITMLSRHGRRVRIRFFPVGFEYSVKDDKIRVVADGCRHRYFNVGRMESCELCAENGLRRMTFEPERKRTLTLQITDERNALERVMLHFAHFEKRAERADDGKYLLHLKYYESDETEIVIRVLSFGPYVKVLEPQTFVELIRERLREQKVCGLK